jgi:CRP-like cAMP-binding protein
VEPPDIETQTFETGEVLIAPGSAADTAFVLLSGSVCVEDEVDAPPLIIGPGEMIGDLALLLDQPHSASVVALERVSAVRLTRLQIAAAMRSAPNASAAQMRELFAGLARRLAERQKAGASRDSREARDWSAVILTAEAGDLVRHIGNGRLTRRDLPFTIGRKPGRRESAPPTAVSLVLPDNQPFNLSRCHFAIDIQTRSPVIRDAGSQLGTLVNGVRIGAGRPSNTAPLNPGANRVVAGAADSPFRFVVTVETD